ncbi:F-box protein CPR1 [Sesamum alatum]|uniref:F-box protein CPR1 n=1 Tax=Sesamum alatum TaxID=300844 RepID=A0AAE1Y9I6_9LAMI|nr:F-box protein CPR1 [Sesamum alatum]
MELGDLPQEILIEIFSRLPPKSLGKCRCSAKLWLNLLSTPHFIKSHLTRKTHQEYLIVNTTFDPTYSISTIKDDSIWKTLPAGLGLRDQTHVVGSCDGLVLIVPEYFDKLLVNPITMQQLKIPNSPLALNRSESVTMHGFGYDSCSDDYKVVMLSYYDADNEHDSTFVDVYSVKRGVWKRVHNSPYDHPFNLADEVFNEISAPSGVNLRNFPLNKLVVRGECLCMIEYDRTDVWTMEEYGLKESWTKFGVHADNEYFIQRPLGWFGDEELVLVTKCVTLVVYNRTNGILRMVIKGDVLQPLDGCTFVESLVSPALISA